MEEITSRIGGVGRGLRGSGSGRRRQTLASFESLLYFQGQTDDDMILLIQPPPCVTTKMPGEERREREREQKESLKLVPAAAAVALVRSRHIIKLGSIFHQDQSNASRHKDRQRDTAAEEALLLLPRDTHGPQARNGSFAG